VGLKGLEAKMNWLVVNHQSLSNFALDFPELLVSFHAFVEMCIQNGYRDGQVCPSVRPQFHLENCWEDFDETEKSQGSPTPGKIRTKYLLNESGTYLYLGDLGRWEPLELRVTMVTLVIIP
jgi:hypothetical protein